MIKQTKASITDYVGDLYSLNSKVQETNSLFKETGHGYGEETWKPINTAFNFYTPGGNKNRLFKNE